MNELADGADHRDLVLADTRPDAPWRAAVRLALPRDRLGEALDSLRRFVLANPTATYDAMLAAATQEPDDEEPLDGMVRDALLSISRNGRLGDPGAFPPAPEGFNPRPQSRHRCPPGCTACDFGDRVPCAAWPAIHATDGTSLSRV